ncbi:hypothetical protein EST38_g8442 [Candolleomyces aberdarensis]|uniref:F-box domain-containing protein n=1 Tax=Candolleomyces aberdarensis TaxID=2316362 RepID=A0A4Q2DFY6_9AGAR|nr:hypothetical protein EST38_g8442 [Candolleomyces aberdarensis]
MPIEVDQPECIDDIFNCPPAYNAIFSCLSPADVIRVSKTCRLLRDAAIHFHHLAYNVNRHLEHFVREPLALRRLQVKHRFLISGSNALQFLDRTFYPSSDLDIFAFPDNVKEIGYHLINEEGYVFEPSPTQPKKYDEVTVKARDLSTLSRWASQADFVYNSGMSDLLRFKNAKRDLEIQLIVCRRAPLDCILYFHSTPVMNFIAHDAAYSLYPKATFDKRIAISFGWDSHEATKKALDKYSERGWSFVDDLSYQNVKAVSPAIVPDVERYLDDRDTWILPLDTDGLGVDADGSSAPSRNPFHCNSWKLKRDFHGYSTQIELGITYEIYHAPKHFEHAYLIADRGLREAMDQLIDYLTEQNPSRNENKKFLDSFLPSLRDAHLEFPKRIYQE